MSKIIMLILSSLLVTSCANGLIKTKLPENMMGKLNITKVNVDKLSDIPFKGIEEKVKTAVEKELDKKDKGDIKATMNITIQNWQEAKTGALSKVMGSSSSAKGLVKIIDTDGNVISEYGVVAENKIGGLIGGTVNFEGTAETMMLRRFGIFTLSPIY